MEEKQIAAILMGAAATVFAARLQTADAHEKTDIRLGLCAVEVFTAWRDMLEYVHNLSKLPPLEAKEQ